MTGERKPNRIDHIDFPIDWKQPSYRIVSTTRRNSNDRIRINLKPFFLGFNQVAIDAPVSHPAHRHSSFELIVVKEGPYRCRLNGESIQLKFTNCLLIKPGDFHEVDLRPGQRHYVLQFDLEEALPNSNHNIFVFDRNLDPAQQAFSAPIAEIEPLLKSIADQAKHDRRFASEIQDSLIELIFWILVSYIPANRLSPAFRKMSNDQQFLNRLEDLALSHYGKHLTLDKLAKQMDISKSTLAKRCSELLGESPSHYLLRVKIEQAANLLKTTDAPIKEISFNLGFQNPYHFSRVFKRLSGQSPSEFRNQNNDQSSR